MKKRLGVIEKCGDPAVACVFDENSPNPPAPANCRWKMREIWREYAPHRIMCVRAIGDVVLVSSYNSKTKNQSWLHAYIAGQWQKIYEGCEEALGPIGEWDKRFYFCSKNGEHILSVGFDGDVKKHAKMPDTALHAVVGTIWRKRPVFTAVSAHENFAYLYDAIRGEQISKFPLSGLITGLCVDGYNDLLAAHACGDVGLSSEGGLMRKNIHPTSVAWDVDFGVIVGGGAEGAIWILNKDFWMGGPVSTIKLNCSRVNRVVAAHRRVWFAASGPDLFGFLANRNEAITIAQFKHELPAMLDDLFGVDIWPISEAQCFIARTHSHGCVVYECKAR